MSNTIRVHCPHCDKVHTYQLREGTDGITNQDVHRPGVAVLVLTFVCSVSGREFDVKCVFTPDDIQRALDKAITRRWVG